MYSHVGSGNNNDYSDETSSRTQETDSLSVASSKRRFGRKRINSDLSEPLTSGTSVVDESLGGGDRDHLTDPYFVFRADLQKKLEQVDDSLVEYLRIVHDTDTSVNVGEYKDSKKQLKRHLKNAESTLRDVLMTVSAVENDREKFPHIDDGQLFERKSLVNTSKERLVKAKDEINSESVKLKLLEDERNKAIRRSGDGLLGAKNDLERHNTGFVLDHQAQTSLLMQQQDETLDELGEAVHRVGEMAGNIHEEIGQQNKMLEEMEEDMTNVEEELGMVMGKLAKFLNTKDRWQLRTILSLSLVAFILFFLVLYS